MRRAMFATFLRAAGPVESARPDERLLADFFAHRDEEAFATLVRRHERTVWGVCRRMLANPADAEDAFQATFLVLVCRGRALAGREGLGGWLYGVAHRVALKARTAAHRRRLREERAAKPDEASPEPEDSSDLLAVVGEELARLPEPHRAAIVVCDLDGLSRADAADRLGCSEGTLSARLSRGRKQLANRLKQRGIATPALGCAALLAAVSPASAGLTSATVALANSVMILGIENRAVSASVAALVTATTRDLAMRFTIKLLAITLLTAALLGGGWLGWPNPHEPTASAAPVPPVKNETKVEVPGSAYNLLRERKVLRELKCTAEQRMQIEDALDALAEARPRIAVDLAPIANTPNDIRPALELHLAKLTQVAEGEATAIGAKYLTRPQLVRLRQIGLQTGGLMTFADDKVADELKLDDEQRKGVRRAINEAITPPPGTPPFVAPPPKKIAAALETVMAILTKEQTAVWNAMIGEKIGFQLPPVNPRDRLNLFTDELMASPPKK